MQCHLLYEINKRKLAKSRILLLLLSVFALFCHFSKCFTRCKIRSDKTTENAKKIYRYSREFLSFAATTFSSFGQIFLRLQSVHWEKFSNSNCRWIEKLGKFHACRRNYPLLVVRFYVSSMFSFTGILSKLLLKSSGWSREKEGIPLSPSTEKSEKIALFAAYLDMRAK